MPQRGERVARITLKDGKVLLISNLVITHRYLHPDYICTPGPGAVADKGLVTIFELLEKDEGIPSFAGWWDSGRAERRPLDLEIDISGVPIGVIRKFRNNSDGYNTQQVDRSPDENRRLYEVRIESPSGLIFDAAISFFNTHEAASHNSADLGAAVDGAMNRAETIVRLPDRSAARTEALRIFRNASAVAWLQEKLRSCFTFLSSRRH